MIICMAVVVKEAAMVATMVVVEMLAVFVVIKIKETISANIGFRVQFFLTFSYRISEDQATAALDNTVYVLNLIFIFDDIVTLSSD